MTSTAPRTSKLDSRSSRLSGRRRRRGDQRDDADGDVDEEDPRPRQQVDEDAAEEDAGSGADAADRTPGAECDVALAALAEHRRQDREGGRRDRRCAESLQSPGRDQRGLTPRQPAEQRAEGEDDEADHEDAPPPAQVGEPASEEQEAAEHERVRRDHPLQVLLREPEVDLDRRQRDVHDRDIENDHELHHAQQEQCDPLASV